VDPSGKLLIRDIGNHRIRQVDFSTGVIETYGPERMRPSATTFGTMEKMLWGERRGQWHHRRSCESMERPMPQLNDLSRSLVVLEQDATLIAVIEMGQSSWLVAGIVPGVERSPLKKLAVDESALLKLLNRWREEAEKAGHRIERIAIAFEAGRDGFWLARWLWARDIEAHDE
jgi:hypothetical protein